MNGGGGVLFNDTPTVEGDRGDRRGAPAFGTTGFLPTLITDTPREDGGGGRRGPRRHRCRGVPGLLGVHLEGPFLNPERKGVHDPQFMRPIDDEDIAHHDLARARAARW